MLTTLLAILAILVLIWVLAFHSASALTWTIALGAALAMFTAVGILAGPFAALVWIAFLAFALIANVKSLRRALVTAPIFSLYKKILPQMSQTEQEALEAGTVWWDSELFTGRPDWCKLLADRKSVV